MLTEELIRGQAQHLIGALLAHNFVPKTLPEELYVKLWDVVMAQLKCVNHEGARAIESAACAERDARIAELTRELEEARKDEREHWENACRLMLVARSGQITDMALAERLVGLISEDRKEKQAIRAAIKEQT